MNRRDLQLAANEAMFRDVNETVVETTGRARDESVQFLCECADEFCAASIPLTPHQYEHVRAVAAHFILKPGHSRPEIERVVERHHDYWIVEKIGEAAEIAEATDPRS
jgi:hypothetical protein